jgi:hypothetical protein
MAKKRRSSQAKSWPPPFTWLVMQIAFDDCVLRRFRLDPEGFFENLSSTISNEISRQQEDALLDVVYAKDAPSFLVALQNLDAALVKDYSTHGLPKNKAPSIRNLFFPKLMAVGPRPTSWPVHKDPPDDPSL